MRLAFFVLPLSLVMLGCDDPLKEAQVIESTRVLAARVEPAGDATRAWPEPGEAASVRWLVVDPRPTPALGWAFELCAAVPTERGIPVCAAPPFATASSPTLSPAAPSVPFTTPDAERLLIRGAICSDAQPVLGDPLETSSCAGELDLVLFEIEVGRAGETHRNPTFAGASLGLDDAPWSAPSDELLALESCSVADAAPGLPIVAAGSATRRIQVVLPSEARDDGETLFISHFSTAGRLDRSVSAIEPDQSELAVTVDYDPPGSVGVARLYFVVRDLRGGVDWTARTLCVVP